MENLKIMTINKETKNNALAISSEISWLVLYIGNRLEAYFDINKNFIAPKAPDLKILESKYSGFIINNNLSEIERFFIITCLALHFKPQVFDTFLVKNKVLNKRFTEFGGKIDESKSIFVPTLETIAFIFYGESFESRFLLHSFFEDDHIFKKENILEL
jgi:hypothetical protein